jgi:small-conductance mechanosensitive channel
MTSTRMEVQLVALIEGLGGGKNALLVVETLIFVLLVGAILLGLMVGKRLLSSAMQRLHIVERHGIQTSAVIKTLLERMMWFTPVAIAGLIALAIHHPLSPRLELTFRITCLSLLFIQAGIWASALLNLWLEKGIKFFRVSDQATNSALGVVRFFALTVIWSGLLLMILANMGVQIGPLLTGLGIGGVAIAFALQKILGDVFCSVAIILDKPFEVGDFIIVDPANMGTVERIGIKTTRVRSLTGEEIIFSNADLLEARVHNFKRMNERRVLFPLGLLYQTPPEVLAQIVPRIRAIIEGIEKTRFDRGHLKAFGPSSYDFEFVYYVLDRDMTLYMDIQQKINFGIIELLKELGADFAYPTQTLHIESLPQSQQVPAAAPTE